MRLDLSCSPRMRCSCDAMRCYGVLGAGCWVLGAVLVETKEDSCET
jgi:hypothetical protein